MTDLTNTNLPPIEGWEHWPLGKFQKGDLIKVVYAYDGIHGPVHSEYMYLLLACTKKEISSERWSCFVIVSNDETQLTNMYEHTIDSEDFESFKQTDPDDWQRIFLIARNEG